MNMASECREGSIVETSKCNNYGPIIQWNFNKTYMWSVAFDQKSTSTSTSYNSSQLIIEQALVKIFKSQPHGRISNRMRGSEVNHAGKGVEPWRKRLDVVNCERSNLKYQHFRWRENWFSGTHHKRCVGKGSDQHLKCRSSPTIILQKCSDSWISNCITQGQTHSHTTLCIITQS